MCLGFKRVGVMLLAAMVIMTTIPFSVVATENDIEIVFEDITSTDTTVLEGEAKLKVYAKGVTDKVSIAQVVLDFDGDLKYKSIDFLVGENNPSKGNAYITPNAAYSNATGEIGAGILSVKTPMVFQDKQPLFIVTFSGEKNNTVTVTLDKANSFFTISGNDYVPADSANKRIKGSSTAAAGKTATVQLSMSKVNDFTVGTGSAYTDSRINLAITNERTKTTIYTAFNTAPIKKGGHYDSTKSTPTFIVTNEVISTDTYTVEITGSGYVPYKKSGITFDKALELTNDDFIPGDLNNDGKVTAEDKTLCENASEDNTLAEELDGAADLNRDSKVDKYDLAVFDKVELDTIPDTPPTDGEEGESGDDSGEGSGEGSGGGGGAGGGGAGGGGGGGGAVAPKDEEKPTDKTEDKDNQQTKPDTGSPTTETFTDLESYSWAKESIYALKDKGIISGVSETEFAPQNQIKRGDFILILVRMLGLDNEYSGNFADVKEGSYYYEAIARAKAAGIAQGSGDSFMPENTITRQDLITLAYRAFKGLGYIGESTDLSVLEAFSDKADIADYAKDAMASMVGAGIIKGSDGRVNPRGNATRAEVAVMCYRLTELMR